MCPLYKRTVSRAAAGSTASVFTARCYASAVLAMTLGPSVCPSVCPSQVGVLLSFLSTPLPMRPYGNKRIAVRKVATPLRELTCHMGSHSVTCHPAELTFRPYPQPKLVLDSATQEGCKAELT